MNRCLPAWFLITGVMLSPAIAQTTYFSTGFEYLAEPSGLLESIELNGATDQVGYWSGDDFPEAAAAGYFSGGVAGGDSAGFVDNPHGGRMLHVDLPLDDALHFMNLSQTIPNIGATVSFTAGTIRSGEDGRADYDLFGLDAVGNESFRVRIGTDGATQRLGYVAGGGTAKFDLPTTVGQDDVGDLVPSDVPLSVGDDLARVTLILSDKGYVLDYSNLNFSNSYRTDLLPYNGTANELASVGLLYRGSEDVSQHQSGFVLDDLRVAVGEVVDPPTGSLLGRLNSDQKIVLLGNGQRIVGLEFRSATGLLIPAPEDDATPWEFMLANTSERITLGSLVGAVTVDGELVTTVGYAGLDPESDLDASWGNETSAVVKFSVLNPVGEFDCNGDGKFDANDLACGCSSGSVSDMLAALELLAGDLDADRSVGFADFLILAENFGQVGQYADGDIDCNGKVEFGDFVVLAENYGKSSRAAASVPEPSGLALLAAGLLGCASRRRRS